MQEKQMEPAGSILFWVNLRAARGNLITHHSSLVTEKAPRQRGFFAYG
jgi:hypothetical protein